MDEDYFDIGEETVMMSKGFTFRPACGELNHDGSVTVSGFNFTQEQIQDEGREWRELIDALKGIKESTSDGHLSRKNF